STASTTPPTRPATTWPRCASTGSSIESPARTATDSPATGCGSRSSAPNCTATGCCAPCSSPTSHPPRHQYEKHYAPSTLTSQNSSTTPDCRSTQPENSRQVPLGTKGP